MGALALRDLEKAMEPQIISVARDFSAYPGGRYAKDGDFSGEEFRDQYLWPAVSSAIARSGHVIIELDGTAGYPASFLEEAFGGLIRKYNIKSDRLLTIVDIRSIDPHYDAYRRLAKKYILEAGLRERS